MNFDFSTREGIPLLADFYTLSTFYQDDNFLDREIAVTLLPVVKSRLLKYTAIAILGECRYVERMTKFSQICNRFGVLEQPIINLNSNSGIVNKTKAYFIYKRRKQIPRVISAAKATFHLSNWRPSYGGPSWARICSCWLNLQRQRNCNFNDSFVLIDNLIDAAHNTGRCLDKILPDINLWLRYKTQTTNPFWVVDQSCIKTYAYRRLYERYGFTHEKSAA